MKNKIPRTLLITGASGFLGRNFLNSIKKKKYNIIVVTTNKKNKVFKKMAYKSVKKFDYSKKDLIRISRIKNIFGIIHLSTAYGRKNNNKNYIYNANYDSPLKLFKIINKDNLNFFLNTDTYYERNLALPNGLREYVKSKKDFVKTMRRICLNESFNFINCIIHHMYGPNDSDDKFIPSMVKRLKKNEKIIDLTKGNQKKDFIHVKDVSSAIIKIIETHTIFNNIENDYEIGSNKSYSIKYVMIKLKNILRSKSKLNFGAIDSISNEKHIYKANCKNLFKIGWKPKIDINKGLENFK